VDGGSGTLPEGMVLSQNYPNPFNPETIIRYFIPTGGKVSLIVHDILGQEVALLADGYQDAGEHMVQVRAGELHLSSGIYFYTLSMNGLHITKMMSLVR
jgi:hypothetical protein